MELLSSSVPLRNPKISPSVLLSPTPARRVCLPRTVSGGKRAFSLKCSRADFYETQQQRVSGPGEGAPMAKVFVGHSIYKGKAALTVEPRAPEFAPLDVFSLSVSEIGTLMNLGTKDSCEFFHDPFKGKSDEGKIRKVLKAEPFPDGGGHFFNLSVQNRLQNVDENIYIPITRAEFTVLNSAFNFVIPYFLGWHAFVESMKAEDGARSNGAGRSGAESEWGR